MKKFLTGFVYATTCLTAFAKPNPITMFELKAKASLVNLMYKIDTDTGYLNEYVSRYEKGDNRAKSDIASQCLLVSSFRESLWTLHYILNIDTIYKFKEMSSENKPYYVHELDDLTSMNEVNQVRLTDYIKEYEKTFNKCRVLLNIFLDERISQTTDCNGAVNSSDNSGKTSRDQTRLIDALGKAQSK